MKVLILTGGIGSGKTTVLELIQKHHPEVFCQSADSIAHGITGTEKFRSYLKTLGVKDLHELGKLMFADRRLKRKVESYVHWRVALKLLFGLLRAWAMGYLVCVVEIPIWFELSLWKMTKGNNVLVVAPMEDRIQRVINRDGLSREQVLHRINAQMPDSEKIVCADYVLHNAHSKETLERELKTLMRTHRPSFFIHKVIFYYGAVLLLFSSLLLLFALFAY